MSISAQRFNILDKETNIPIKDFISFNDNAVYNIVDQIVDSDIINNQNNDVIINALQDNLNSLSSLLINDKVTEELKNAVDSAIDTISNMELPDVVKDIFDSVKKLDLNGVKDFLKELLHIGSNILCNNLDFLKLFMLGFALNKNILSGLLIALLLSWLDRYCKNFTKEEIVKSNNRQQLDMMFPPKGVTVNSSNAFDLFTNYYSDYLKFIEPLSQTTAINVDTFLNNILNGDISSSIDNLRNSEISHIDRKNYINILDVNLSSYSPNSPEYNNILTARGELLKTPLISSERRDRNIKYSNLHEKLGSYIKNLSTVNLQPANFMNLSTIEESLYNKISQLKTIANNSSILQSTPTNSFSNFNFNSILPTLDSNEISFLKNKTTKTDSHRLYDLHPTTEVFLET